MTKAEVLAEEMRYEEYREQYSSESLTVLVDKVHKLEETPGSDVIEIKAIRDVIATMDCDMNPYVE